MKVCDNCYGVNHDDATECIYCGEGEFNQLQFIAGVDDIEPYLRKEDDNRDRGQVP